MMIYTTAPIMQALKKMKLKPEIMSPSQKSKPTIQETKSPTAIAPPMSLLTYQYEDAIIKVIPNKIKFMTTPFVTVFMNFGASWSPALQFTSAGDGYLDIFNFLASGT